MRVLNWSYRVGCLQCSFNDKDLNEYVQLREDLRYRKKVLCKKLEGNLITHGFWEKISALLQVDILLPVQRANMFGLAMCFPVQESHRHHWDAIFCFLILLNL